MTEIKICGITNIEDALCAADCGVDALGFNFHEPSPRYVTPERAREIISALPADIVRVGIFVNREAGEVKRTAEGCGMDLIQLHGDESPEYCRQFPAERIIKAVSPRTPEELPALDAYDVRAFLMDSREPGRYGGTGKQTDWNLAAMLGRKRPLILAGGLREENIAEALSAVAPQAVDINSGIERTPGVKDHGRMRRIVAIIRRESPVGPGVIFGDFVKSKFSPPSAGGDEGEGIRDFLRGRHL